MSSTAATIEPDWIDEQDTIAIHRQQIAEHGGSDGVRDMGLLQSALARPLNAYHYNHVVSLAKLAACYAFGIAKNHAFVDGNKRTALVVSLTFLKVNGYKLNSTQEENHLAFYQLAEGTLSEEELAAWMESKAYKVT
jgi:death on curing protein